LYVLPVGDSRAGVDAALLLAPESEPAQSCVAGRYGLRDTVLRGAHWTMVHPVRHQGQVVGTAAGAKAMTWPLVLAFVVGGMVGMVVMALMAASSREDDWKDSQ
jgi:DMSO/TMAO reductase YedYZ heme-binding membrane subunit